MSSTYKEVLRILSNSLEQKKVSRVVDTVLQWANSTPEALTGDELRGALDFVEGSLEIHVPDASDRERMLSQLRSL